MYFILLTLNLSNNLLSINKITKNLDCSITFNFAHCVFQDNQTKMTIGIGREEVFLLLGNPNCGFQVDKDWKGEDYEKRCRL